MKKLLAVLMALLMVLCLAGCGETEEAVEEAVEEVAEEELVEALPEVKDDYASFIAAAIDDEIEIYCSVQDHESWWDGAVTIYAQDDDGGYLLYEAVCDEATAELLTPGTLIRAKGYKAEWSGEVEIAEAEIEIIVGGYDGKVYEAEDLTSLIGNNDELAKHMNKKVSFKNLTVVNYTYNWDGSGTRDNSDVYLNVTDENGTAFTLIVRRYLTGPETDLFKGIEELKEGDVIDVDTYLYWYEGPQARIYNYVKH